MEVVTMHSSHHSSMDPSYLGQASSAFLNTIGGQQSSDKEHHLHGTPGFQHTSGAMSATRSLFSPQHDEYPDEVMDSPDLSSVSWDDFAPSPWDMPVPLSEHHGNEGRVSILQPLHMHHDVHFDAARSHAGYHQTDHPIMPTTNSISGASSMTYSASASPAPEILQQEPFTHPLTPASFDAEPPIQAMQNRNNTGARHHHVKSTPSPSRSQASPGLLRHKSAPTGQRSGSKVAKNTASPKTAPTSAPNNARSAHSAIERKYRENINNKIAELHKVLCSAGPPLIQDSEVEVGGYPYSRLSGTEEDEHSGVESNVHCGQSVLPAKKADVLAGAISYVRRNEKERKLLMDQLNSMTARLQQYEVIVRGRNRNIA